MSWTAAIACAAAGASWGLWTRAGFGCDPEWLPICGRSAYLAKSVAQVVVNPGTPAPINVPVGLVPHVEWDDQNARCAQPTTHVLSLTVTCVEQGGGGAPITIGPIAVPMQDARPTVPGNQPVAGGSPFTLVIPQGTLDPAKQYRCTIDGSYSITFAGGRGAGTIVGTGPVTFCTVPPAPGTTDVPILNVREVGEVYGLRRAQPGDQIEHVFLVENNCPTPCMVAVSMDTENVARMPQFGAGEEDFTYSISSDVEGADRYAIGVAESVPFGRLLRRGDPAATSAGPSRTSLVLAPYEIAFVTMAVASYGMCADGSCSEDTVTFASLWPGAGAGGADVRAEACLGVVTQASYDVPARNALCSAALTAYATNDGDLRTSQAAFDDVAAMSVFTGNHLEPNASSGFSRRVVGANVAPLIEGNISGLYPTETTDWIRFSAGERWIPGEVAWANAAFDLNAMRTGFDSSFMSVDVKGLRAGLDLEFPQLRWGRGTGASRLEVDLGRDAYRLYAQDDDGRDRRVFSGNREEFDVSGEFLRNLEIGYRLQTFSPPPDAVRLVSAPNAYAWNLGEDEDVATWEDAFTVFNALDFRDMRMATIDADPGIVIAQGAQFGEPTDIGIEGGLGFPLAPESAFVGEFEVDAAQALVPLGVYWAARRVPDAVAEPEPLAIRSVTVTVNQVQVDADTIVVEVTIHIEAGFEPAQGYPICVSAGGRDAPFVLDGRFFRPWDEDDEDFAKPKKPKPPLERLELKLKRKHGQVIEQDAVLRYSGSRLSLGGWLADEGLLDADLKDARREIPVRVLFGSTLHEAKALVDVDAKAGKKLKAKSVRQ